MSKAAVPRLGQKPPHMRVGRLPVIQHPMSRMGDRRQLSVTGTASLDMGRPHTVIGQTRLGFATCVSWSQSDLVGTKKRRYRKKAMATHNREDQDDLELVTERLVDSFQGIKNLFKENYEPGMEAVSRDSLYKIMLSAVGYIAKDRYDRLLLNLGLDRKDRITFDMFVSRFKEFKDIMRQWSPPVKRAADADIFKAAHPEEELRDCDVKDWGRLKVAPEATYQLLKALRGRKVDLRSLLPDECYKPCGVVTKVQMRVALTELGINLTDLEYKRFWERYDTSNAGYVPLTSLRQMLNQSQEDEPLSRSPAVRTPVTLKANTGLQPRNPAVAAREFAIRRHKPRHDPLLDVRGEGLQSPLSARLARSELSVGEEGEGEGDGTESPTADAAARAKIRSAMNQRQAAKFDCIVDCLHHKFEERYTSMMQAFKLFDIHDDGCVMRVDFRRVLTEFGFPVTACQLGSLIQRLGLSINHGLISYRRLLSKMMQRTDALTAQVLDDKIQALYTGMAVESASGADTDEEVIARNVTEYLHHEYIKLAADFLRADKKNTGVMDVEEVKKMVERCLGVAMTTKQWEDFQGKLPYDAEGLVRYVDFMISFNGTAEPGSWNQLTFGSVTVPRNKVVNPPSDEVRRLERAKTEMPAPVVKPGEKRPLLQLRKELKEFFTDHLHDVDKRFKELDRKSHKRFSKWQFGALLKLCGFPMTEKELTDVWLSIKLSDDNMSTFNNVVMEFAPNFTPFRTECPEGEDQAGGEKGREQGGGKDSPAHSPPAPQTPATPYARSITPGTYLVQILAKAQPAVRKNWEYLRQGFRSHDPHGFGSVTFQRMQHLLDSLRCGLTKDERDQICAQFDFKSIGRCNYLAFMKTFGEMPPKEPRLVFDPRRHRLEKQVKVQIVSAFIKKEPRDAPLPLTLDDALTRIRNKLIKHWKNLRRGFQKSDRERVGSLSTADFKRVLRECGVPVTEEDLYHIFSQFDSNMNNRISYPEFLNALLRVDGVS